MPTKELVPYRKPIAAAGRATHTVKKAAKTTGEFIIRNPGPRAKSAIVYPIKGIHGAAHKMTFPTIFGVPRLIALEKGDTKSAAEERKKRFGWSVFVYGVSLFFLFTAGWWLYENFHGWVGVALYVLGCLVTAGLTARILDKDSPIIPPKKEKRDTGLNAKNLSDIFRTLKLLKPLDRDGEPVRGSELESRQGAFRSGDGWEISAKLPQGCGTTVAKIIAAKEAIAAELDVDASQLLIEKDGSDSAFRLWLADSDPFEGSVVSSPYVEERATTSVWNPVRLGRDARGNPVIVDLMFNSFFIAGLPRQGKSSLARILSAYVALDPHAQVVVIDGKGAGDFNALDDLANRLVQGADDEDIVATIETLKDLMRQVEARYKLFLTKYNVRKLSRDLAEKEGMAPIFLIIDELQEILDAADMSATKGQRKLIEDMISRLARKAPAAGVTMIVSTQRPSSDSVPSGFRGNVRTRIALPVDDRHSNDIILGDGASGQGLKAQELPRMEANSGNPALAILKDGAVSATFAIDWIDDGEEFEAICERGWQFRDSLGILTPKEEKEVTFTLLDWCIKVMEEAGVEEMAAAELASRVGITHEKPAIQGTMLSKALKKIDSTIETTTRGNSRVFVLIELQSKLG